MGFDSAHSMFTRAFLFMCSVIMSCTVRSTLLACWKRFIWVVSKCPATTGGQLATAVCILGAQQCCYWLPSCATSQSSTRDFANAAMYCISTSMEAWLLHHSLLTGPFLFCDVFLRLLKILPGLSQLYCICRWHFNFCLGHRQLIVDPR